MKNKVKIGLFLGVVALFIGCTAFWMYVTNKVITNTQHEVAYEQVSTIG